MVRNRIRRRLKAAVSAVAEMSARPGYDYVLIARGKRSRSIRQIEERTLNGPFIACIHAPAAKPRRYETEQG